MRNVVVEVHDGTEKAEGGKVTTWSLYLGSIRRRRYANDACAWLAAEVRTPQVMDISGAVGDNATKVNGTYDHVPGDPSVFAVRHKCVLYKRRAETTQAGPQSWLKFVSRRNRWLVCTTMSGTLQRRAQIR